MFLQTGEAESAEAVCANALDQHPEDANFLCLSARALLKLRRFSEANARIDLALSIFPEFQRAHEVRGELLLAKGQLPAAAERHRKLASSGCWSSAPAQTASADSVSPVCSNICAC